MKTVRVGQHQIGEKFPTFFIAEAGANWRISPDPKKNYQQALRLIDIAVAAGCESVKFQLYRAKKLYVPSAGTADYLRTKKSIFDIIQEMELPYEWLKRLKSYCDRRGIMFLCTPFDPESVDELERIGVVAYKIASYSLTHYPLLRYVARQHKPIFMSTGASDMHDVAKALRIIADEGNRHVVVLQCTAKYPAPLTSLNLRVINTLQRRFGIPIGLSDHSREPSIGPMGAVALGARVIEKHFTTNNNLPGPDHKFAVLPDELAEMVANVRKLEAALGDGRKRISKPEEELAKFTEYRIFATQDISAGQPLEGRVDVLRSGKVDRGLFADKWEWVIKRRAKCHIQKNSPITSEMVR